MPIHRQVILFVAGTVTLLAASRMTAAAEPDTKAATTSPATDSVPEWPKVRVPRRTQAEQDRLVAKLMSPTRGDRYAAVEALDNRGWKPADDRELALVMVATGNAGRAEQYGDAAVEALCLAVLDPTDAEEGRHAADCLGHILNTSAIGPLGKALRESPDAGVRGAAAAALGRIRDRDSATVLKQASEKESDEGVKTKIAAALAKVTDESQPDRLVAALKDDDDKTQFRAAVLLTRANNPAGLEWMEHAINGDDTELRTQAMPELTHNASALAIKILVKRVDGKGYDGPTEAVDALVSLGEPSIAPMVDALAGMKSNGRRMMLQGLARLGEPAMKPLTASLPTANFATKKELCETFGAMGDRADVKHKPIEPLVALLTDADEKIRRSAADSLERLKWEPTNDEQRQQYNEALGKKSAN